MIDVQLKKSFPSFDVNISFSSDSAGITVLAGPSGSGKTTIINMIAGLVRPDKGRICINGRVLFDSGQDINCPVQARRCGYIFQDGRLFPHMTVRKNLLYGINCDPSKLEDVTRLLGICHLLDRLPGTLSGGEKQRVAIGRALLMKPWILLMDEPLASLDPARKNELLPYIADLPEQFGIPIFYVTHSRLEIIRLSDELIRINEGRVQSSGKPQGEFLGLGVADGDGEYVSVIDCEMMNFNPVYNVVEARFPGGIIRILDGNPPRGKMIRAAIKASDVVISLDKPENISTNNIFRGIIRELEESNGDVLVHTDIGVPLAALILKISAVRLNLKPGTEVYLLVKSVSLIY